MLVSGMLLRKLEGMNYMSDNKKIKQFKKRIDTDKERSLKLIVVESE